MGVATTNGSRLWIGGRANSSVTTVTQFAALTWVEVNDVEDLGNLGETYNEVKFTALKDGRARKFKGTVDGGTETVVVGLNDADTGQIAMDAAELDTVFDYAFKIQLNNPVTPLTGAGAIRYFCAKVNSAPESFGNTDAINKKTYNLGVVSPIVKVAAT